MHTFQAGQAKLILLKILATVQTHSRAAAPHGPVLAATLSVTVAQAAMCCSFFCTLPEDATEGCCPCHLSFYLHY